MTKRPAVSYGRQSTKQQAKGTSSERQDVMTAPCALNSDLEYIEHLFDDGLSGYSGANLCRGELGKFIKKLEENLYPPNLVFDIENTDRLTRLPTLEALDLIRHIIRLGVEVRTRFDGQCYTKESLENNPNQLLVLVLKLDSANRQSAIKSEHGLFNWDYKWKNADKKIATKICPDWLIAKEDRTGFVLKPHAKRTIKKIFSLSINQNMGAYAITSFLNSKIDLYPSFSKKLNYWSERTVKKLLKNSAVYGSYFPHKKVDGKRIPLGIELECYFPAVITKDEFFLSLHYAANRKNNGGGRKGIGFSNLFTKMVVCGCCGARMVYKDKGKKPKGGKYLVCSNTQGKSLCQARSIEYKKFERDILTFVNEIELDEIINTKSKEIEIANDQLICSLKHQIQNCNLKIESLLELDLNDKTLVANKINKLTAEVKALTLQQKQIEQQVMESKEANNTDNIDALIELVSTSFGNDQQLAENRKLVHGQLAKLVSRISIHTNLSVWRSDENQTMLTKPNVSKIRNLAKLSGLGTNKFLSQEWERSWLDSHIHFKVYFKSGLTKTIYPFTSMTTVSDIKPLLADLPDINTNPDNAFYNS